MVVSKKELKRARKEKKSNLKAGRKSYRLKRQEAKRELKMVSGRRAVLLSHFPKLKRVAATPHQISYQEAIQKAKSEWSDHQSETQDQFEDVLSAANPYDLRSKELREHRLPQAKRRYKEARKHLKMVTEQRKQDVRKQSAQRETRSKVGRFFYQKDKSLDQLQAEKEVFQAREEYQTLKRAKASKAPSKIPKYLGHLLVQDSLQLLAQDEDLAGAKDLIDTSYQVRRYGKATMQSGKVLMKTGQASHRFVIRRLGNTRQRYRNLRAGKGWTLDKKNQDLIRRFKKQAVRRAHSLKARVKMVKTVVSSLTKAVITVVSNPLTWLVSGILGFLLLMMAFFLGFASQSLIQQDEFELTKAYTHMTWEDATHTKTNDKGITYYTKVDEVMAYMNVQFQDYTLSSPVGGLVPINDLGRGPTVSGTSLTLKDYLSNLWEDLNGGSSLKDMSDLIDQPPYKLSEEQKVDLKELSEDGIYASLQELENPFEGQSEDDSLSMSYRYGYYHLDGQPTIQDFIILEAPSEQVIVAPLDGTVEVDGDDVIIAAGKKVSQVKLRLYGIQTGRLATGQKVSAGEIIGQTKDGSGLKVSYQKYDPDEKSLVSVNPAFYFPKVVQLQTTILPHIGQFGGDEFERAKAIYTYLKAKGATNQAIAAILGNWSVESGINPKRAEGDYLSPPVGATETSWDDPAWLSLGGPAIYNGGYPNIIHRGLGLGQWTDTADGSRRHTLLLEYAKTKGKPWYDLELQLDFMLHGDNPYYTNWLKGFFGQTGSPASLAQAFLIYWEGNSGDKLIERQTRATEWYYQIEKGFSQPNGGTAQSDPAALEAVKGDLYENSIPGGGDGMGYAFGQCTWGVAARINQLGLKLKGRNGEKISITSVMGNGQDWVRSAAALGGETGSTPRAGAIISFAGGSHGTLAEYGHVSFVEKVYPDGSFLISETNVNGNPNYTFRKISGPDAAMSFAYTVK